MAKLPEGLHDATSLARDVGEVVLDATIDTVHAWYVRMQQLPIVQDAELFVRYAASRAQDAVDVTFDVAYEATNKNRNRGR